MKYVLSAILVITLVSLTYAQEIGKKESWIVTYIVDGDTFYAEKNGSNRTKFRLIGIDTPESKHPDKPIEPFSQEATNAITKLVDDGNVLLEYDVQTHDKYGRTLVYVYNQKGQFINEELVKIGLAQVYTFAPNIKYSELFYEAQKIARKNKQGIWSDQ